MKLHVRFSLGGQIVSNRLTMATIGTSPTRIPAGVAIRLGMRIPRFASSINSEVIVFSRSNR